LDVLEDGVSVTRVVGIIGEVKKPQIIKM